MFGYEQDNPSENEDCEYDHLEGIVLLRADKIKLHHYHFLLDKRRIWAYKQACEVLGNSRFDEI